MGVLELELCFDESALKTFRRISRDYFPNEACGLLIGEKKDGKIIVKKVIEGENVLESSTTFQIKPELVIEVMEKIENNEENMIGFFHSHPKSPPYVSARDEKFMKLWPGKIWIIAGTNENGKITEIKAFERENNSHEEIKIKLD